MKPAITTLITQKNLDSVIDNDIMALGKRIKQKEENYPNLVSHIKNVPYQVEDVKKVESAPVDFSSAQSQFIVLPIRNLELLETESRAINVKRDNVMNISGHSQVDLKSTQDENPSLSIVSTDEAEMSNSDSVPENSIFTDFDNTSTIETSGDFTEIDNIRQLVQNAKEEARLAQEEVKQSDEDVNKLSIEATDVEKQLADAKIRKEELKKKVMLALDSQSEILKKAKKDYEDIILEANRHKEENQNKIVEFQSKIDENKQLLMKEEQEIREQQELLNALNGLTQNDNMIPFVAPDVDSNESIKRIA